MHYGCLERALNVHYGCMGMCFKCGCIKRTFNVHLMHIKLHIKYTFEGTLGSAWECTINVLQVYIVHTFLKKLKLHQEVHGMHNQCAS